MGKLFLGALAGLILLGLFFYLGGPRYLAAFGAKTEEAGHRLEKYEKRIKESTRSAEHTVKEKADDAKEAYDSAREKVKEYLPR